MLNVTLLKTATVRCRLVVRGNAGEFRMGMAFGWHDGGVWIHLDFGVWMAALIVDRAGSHFWEGGGTDG